MKKLLILLMLFSISAFSQVKIEIIGNYFVATENARIIINHSKDNVRFIIKSPTNPASFYTIFATDFEQTRSFLWTDFRNSSGIAFSSQSVLNTFLYANTGTTVSGGGSGGSGTSDATAALQTAGNTTLSSINAKDFATSTKQDTQTTALNTINTTNNTLFKTGQNIGNTAFAINGTLPAFTTTPTFNIGTNGGISTETTLSTLNNKFVSGTTIGTVNAGTGFQINALTDTQLRASAINVTTSPISVELQNTGPGIVASKSVNVGGVYNSTLPIATTGQGLGISLDAQGRVITSQGANNYIASLDNTTTTQLAAGATFTGLIQDMASYQNFILTVNSNQNYTLNLLQYDDAAGLKLSETTTIVKLANQPINTSFTINGSFARITITNNGAVATTNFYASSFLGVLPTVPTALTPSGSFKVAIMEALPSGSGSIGNINSVTSISNIGISQQNLTEFRNQTLLAVAQSVKVSTGRVYSITIINPNATPVYLKLYNSLIAGITVGTTAAQKVYAVPANGSLLIEPQLIGTNFSTAISTLVTTGFLDSSNTAPATGVYVEIQYL